MRTPEAAHPAAGTTPSALAPLLTPTFVILCAATLLHFMSFSLLSAALPIWALRRGAGDWEIGLLTSLIAFPALVSRSLSGWLVDRYGTRWFIVAGTFIYTSVSLLYGLAPTVGVVLLMRIYHGIGLGLYHTAASVYVTNLVPAARRGEGIGYYGTMQTVAQAAGPALGVLIADQLGYQTLWLTCAALSGMALVLVLQLREARVTRGAVPLRWAAFVARRAVPSALAAFGLFIGSGTVTSFLAVYALDRGIDNPGLLYGIQALATVLARGIAGRLSDQFGRTAVVAPAILIMAAGLAVLSLASELTVFALAGILIGFGAGCAFPALIAQTMDAVGPSRRGAGMSTFGIGQELGIGGGSLLMGLLAGPLGYSSMFGLAAVVPIVALIVALRAMRGAEREAEAVA